MLILDVGPKGYTEIVKHSFKRAKGTKLKL